MSRLLFGFKTSEKVQNRKGNTEHNKDKTLWVWSNLMPVRTCLLQPQLGWEARLKKCELGHQGHQIHFYSPWFSPSRPQWHVILLLHWLWKDSKTWTWTSYTQVTNHSAKLRVCGDRCCKTHEWKGFPSSLKWHVEQGTPKFAVEIGTIF